MIDLATDFIVAYAILGIQRLATSGVAVALVTAAKLVADVDGKGMYEVTATQVLTASGVTPTDKGDAKYDVALLHLS